MTTMYLLNNINDFTNSIKKEKLLTLLDEIILASEEAGYSQDETYNTRQNQINRISELLDSLGIQKNDFNIFKLRPRQLGRDTTGFEHETHDDVSWFMEWYESVD